MRFFVFFLGIMFVNGAVSYAEGLPANPWAKAAPQTTSNTIRSVVDESPTATDAQKAIEKSGEALNPYLINLQNNLEQADIPGQIGNALQSLENINENPQQNQRSAPETAKLPAWQDLLPQADLSSLMPKSTPKKQISKPKSSSGDDEFSKAISDIEKQYNSLKRTTNSYYKDAVKGAREIEKNAKDSVNKLQKMLK